MKVSNRFSGLFVEMVQVLGFLHYSTKDFFIVSNLVDDQNNKVILRNETLI